MLTRYERLTTGCLNGGFLCVEIVWHQTVFHKIGLLHWGVLMLVASILWVIAVAVILWHHRSTILQQRVQGFPPWYYVLLSTPLCIYTALTPWVLLAALGAIRATELAGI